jgi:hypothetical protein
LGPKKWVLNMHPSTQPTQMLGPLSLPCCRNLTTLTVEPPICACSLCADRSRTPQFSSAQHQSQPGFGAGLARALSPCPRSAVCLAQVWIAPWPELPALPTLPSGTEAALQGIAEAFSLAPPQPQHIVALQQHDWAQVLQDDESLHLPRMPQRMEARAPGSAEEWKDVSPGPPQVLLFNHVRACVRACACLFLMPCVRACVRACVPRLRTCRA